VQFRCRAGSASVENMSPPEIPVVMLGERWNLNGVVTGGWLRSSEPKGQGLFKAYPSPSSIAVDMRAEEFAARVASREKDI
jgi:hypothetical protein